MDNPYARWAGIIRAAAYERVATLDRRLAMPSPDAVFFPEALNAVLWSEGVWDRMNADQGTHLDIAEEEDLSPSQSGALATHLEMASHGLAPADALIVRQAVVLLRRASRSAEWTIVAM